MSELPQEELISAYLDGELTAEEKARAEKLLAEDPSAQATLEGLREVSSAVKSLPVFELDENLAADVLKMAERRMLSDDVPSSVAAKSADSLWRTVSRRFLTPRALAWSAAAAMVAIMLIYHNPDQDKPGRGEIAMKAQEKFTADDARTARGPGEFRAAPSIGAPPVEADSMHAASRPADAEAEEFKSSENMAGKAMPKGGPMSAPPAAKPSFAKPSAVDRSPKEEFAQPAMKSVPKKDMPSMGMGGPGMGMGGGMNRNGPGMGMGGGMGKGGPGMGMQMPLAEKAEEGQVRQKAANNARPARRLADNNSVTRGMGLAGEPQIITVRCRVDSRPVAQKALRQILLAQKLMPSKPVTGIEQDEKLSKYGAKQSGEKKRKGTAAGQAKDADGQVQDKLAPAEMPKAASEPSPSQAPPAQTVPVPVQKLGRANQKPVPSESISVEITPAQLEKVLAEIRKQPKVFGQFSVDPDPADSVAQRPAAPPIQQQIPAPNMPPDKPATLGRSINVKVVFLMQPVEAKPAVPAKAKQ